MREVFGGDGYVLFSDHGGAYKNLLMLIVCTPNIGQFFCVLN